mmetsp:Transcript_22728/g.62770  ORF Transcript_22728/g.62770 Transcript_22728/m.62770 type:complete len:219 (+) Transcript_22728:607-1263(+)
MRTHAHLRPTQLHTEPAAPTIKSRTRDGLHASLKYHPLVTSLASYEYHPWSQKPPCRASKVSYQPHSWARVFVSINVSQSWQGHLFMCMHSHGQTSLPEFQPWVNPFNPWSCRLHAEVAEPPELALSWMGGLLFSCIASCVYHTIPAIARVMPSNRSRDIMSPNRTTPPMSTMAVFKCPTMLYARLPVAPMTRKVDNEMRKPRKADKEIASTASNVQW